MPRRHAGGVEVQLYSFLTLLLHGGEVSGWNPTPATLLPRKNHGTHYWAAGWDLHPVWTI